MAIKLGRPLERVRADVLEDMVSPEAARTQYGVVLKKDLALDLAATETLRQRMKRR